jgi:hypothetical protein
MGQYDILAVWSMLPEHCQDYIQYVQCNDERIRTGSNRMQPTNEVHLVFRQRVVAPQVALRIAVENPFAEYDGGLRRPTEDLLLPQQISAQTPKDSTSKTRCSKVTLPKQHLALSFVDGVVRRAEGIAFASVWNLHWRGEAQDVYVCPLLSGLPIVRQASQSFEPDANLKKFRGDIDGVVER